MDFKALFEQFNAEGKLLLPEGAIKFAEIKWSEHPAFAGVELKHLITAQQTQGRFSYHLVRIAPGHKIGTHIHEEQLETHEIISGEGLCFQEGAELIYEPGVIAIFPAGSPHEVIAGTEGLYLFAKFIPALC